MSIDPTFAMHAYRDARARITHLRAFAGLSEPEIKLACWGFVPALVPGAMLRTAVPMMPEGDSLWIVQDIKGLSYPETSIWVRSALNPQNIRVLDFNGCLHLWKRGRIQIIDDAQYAGTLIEQAKAGRLKPLVAHVIDAGDHWRCRSIERFSHMTVLCCPSDGDLCASWNSIEVEVEHRNGTLQRYPSIGEAIQAHPWILEGLNDLYGDL